MAVPCNHQRSRDPTQLLIDVDFAENFTIMMDREIQSQHWIFKMVTLFIGITQHLCSDAWNDTSSSISKGKEVTVMSTSSNAHPTWASVASDYKHGGAHVIVADAAGKQREVLRSNVRVRKLVNTAHVMVSDDKGHDTEFVQKSLPMIDAWAKRSGLGFSEHLIRSDGATSHFKSRCSGVCSVSS